MSHDPDHDLQWSDQAWSAVQEYYGTDVRADGSIDRVIRDIAEHHPRARRHGLTGSDGSRRWAAVVQGAGSVPDLAFIWAVVGNSAVVAWVGPNPFSL